MTTDEYLDLRQAVWDAGFISDYDWSEGLKPPAHSVALAVEYSFVVCNSGMKAEVGAKIHSKIMHAVVDHKTVRSVFKHPGKSKAIQDMWDNREERFIEFRGIEGTNALLEWCQSLPWIGPITKWHLAKNLGANVAKPDRWLERVAVEAGETPAALCTRLSRATGDRIATVDVVVWRACALGIWKASA